MSLFCERGCVGMCVWQTNSYFWAGIGNIMENNNLLVEDTQIYKNTQITSTHTDNRIG